MQRLHALADTFKSAFVLAVFPLAGIAVWVIFEFIIENSLNFEGRNNLNQPLAGNYSGIIYKGSVLVIVLIAFAIVLLTFIVERLIVLQKAAGIRPNKSFIKDLKAALSEQNVDKTIALCDSQKSTVANVIRSGLNTYRTVADDPRFVRKQKLATIQNDLEDASQQELPVLNANLVIISTLAIISTLYGLFRTVTGISKSFAALARVGTTDAVGLAQGISETLVTTVLVIPFFKSNFGYRSAYNYNE